MFKAEAEVMVDVPPAELFAFVADARNRPAWDKGVDSEELTSPEPIDVGSTVRTRMTSMGRVLEWNWRIIEHEPPRQQRIESTDGPFPITIEWLVEPIGPGSRARFVLTGSPNGAMRLMQPLIARSTRKNLDDAFPRLKAVLESG